MKRKGCVVVTIAALACVLLVVFYVYKLATMPPWFPPYDYSTAYEDSVYVNSTDFRKDVGQAVGCNLPGSARDVYHWHDGGKDPTHWIAFTVDAKDLPAIQAQIDPGQWATTMPELPRRVPDEFKSWWNPSSTNIAVKSNDTGPLKGGSGTLWIIDYSTGTVYCCRYDM